MNLKTSFTNKIGFDYHHRINILLASPVVEFIVLLVEDRLIYKTPIEGGILAPKPNAKSNPNSLNWLNLKMI